jgi:signal transduction histidine kinase
MTSPAADIVVRALESSDAATACGRMLDVLRDSFTADAAVLARNGERSPQIVYTDTAAPQAVSADPLSAAPANANPVVVETGTPGESMLAMRLEPPATAPWYLGLVRRSARRWAAADEKALVGLRPHILLVLAHAALQEELAAARDRQRLVEEERERELAVFSHELRNPLAPILMWASTLKRLRPDDDEVQRATQAIAHAVNLERQLIESLSDVSRLQRGALELRRERFDLGTVVRETVALRQREIDDAQLTLTTTLSADPLPVVGDLGRLGQAVGHLLGNAIKFTPAGGTIGITLTRAENGAAVEVSDSGPGLPPEISGRLFAPFIQGPNARGGLGVGLAVARRLIELHGGTIEARPRSERGGASFSIHLPLTDEPTRRY